MDGRSVDMKRDAKPSRVAMSTSSCGRQRRAQRSESDSPREMMMRPRAEMDSKALMGVFLTKPCEVRRTRCSFSWALNESTGTTDVTSSSEVMGRTCGSGTPLAMREPSGT